MPARGPVQGHEGCPALGPRRHGRLLGSLRTLREAHRDCACGRLACSRGSGSRGVLLWLRMEAGRRHD
eukprot:2556316-Alexandrium_andersonii.AAC.1